MKPQEFAKQNLDDLNYFHTKDVVRLTLELAEKEGADKEVVEAAAWLHDIGKIKKEAKAGNHHIFSVEIAKEVLKDKDPVFVEKVCKCILEHMGPPSETLTKLITEAGLTEADIPKPSTVESKVVYDGDMINFMGPFGTAKMIFLLAKMGDSFSSIIKHRTEMPKIIFDNLQTESGKELGKKQLEFIETFMKKIKVEE